MRSSKSVIGAAVGGFLLAGTWFALAQPVASPLRVLEQFHVRIPMRDGIQLSANVFRPNQPGRFPTILLRTPYDKGDTISANARAFVENGYAVVYQDVRGRYESQGAFSPLAQEPADGEDTLNWISLQPWSDGNVGMTGGSYVGIAQWKVAVLNNPHLKAIFPYVSGDDDYRDRFYSPGGAMKLGHRLLWVSENMRIPGYQAPDFSRYIWTLPLRRADQVVTGARSPMMQAVFDHPADDEFWQALSAREHFKKMRVPVFSVGGWYDNYVESDLDAYSRLSKHSAVNRIMIGPWPHNMGAPLSNVVYGPAARVPIRRLQLQWFDQWLKNKETDLMAQPPVRIFVMGTNQWRYEEEWPLARAVDTKFFLASLRAANGLKGDGLLQETPTRESPLRAAEADRFIYDPRHPVPTMGGAVCCDPSVFPWGPMDQRAVENRPDVLVYSTPPLEANIEVTGPIRLVLFTSTTAPDTDFTAKLIDVHPDGRAINLTDGLLRARYHESLGRPKLLKPGQIYKLTIDAGVTSNVFLKGHRIRLEVSSSNFPRFDRNPNTGRSIADETQLVKAIQTVYHDRAHSSYLLLPVIPSAPVSNARLN